MSTKVTELGKLKATCMITASSIVWCPPWRYIMGMNHTTPIDLDSHLWQVVSSAPVVNHTIHIVKVGPSWLVVRFQTWHDVHDAFLLRPYLVNFFIALVGRWNHVCKSSYDAERISNRVIHKVYISVSVVGMSWTCAQISQVERRTSYVRTWILPQEPAHEFVLVK